MKFVHQEILRILGDHEGVLRIGELFDEATNAAEYEKSISSFRRDLLKWEEREGEDCPIRFEVDGYIALQEIDFWVWSAEHRGRPKISEHTALRVWARAAGQCQFPGCTSDLTIDPMTREVGNYAQIAHIIAANPEGPRGSVEDSHRLADEFENLMLLCYPHHRLVDTNVENFPVDVLNEMKRRHEERLDHLLSLTEEQETHMLRIFGVVGGQPARIIQAEAAEALLTKYANPRTLDVDLTDALPDESRDLYWRSGAEILKRRLGHALDPRHHEHLDHLSVFALAPIPLLVLAGRLLGDKRRVELYQHHRDSDSSPWSWWEDGDKVSAGKLNVVRPESPTRDHAAVLALSISHDVQLDEARSMVDGHIDLYEIRVPTPSQTWLKYRSQLVAFRREYLTLQDELERTYGKKRRVHVFAAVPAPVAVDIGRSLHPKVAPELVVYDRVDGHFVRALEIPSDVTF